MTHPGEYLPPEVGIGARLFDGHHSGIQQAVICLAQGPSSLSDGHDKYHFLCYSGHDHWLDLHFKGPCRILHTPAPKSAALLRAFETAPLARIVLNLWGQWLTPVLKRLAASDGTVVRRNLQLMNFPFQSPFIISLPSIYQPWDLQHLHLPNVFPNWQRERRDFKYRSCCQQTRLLGASFRWMKDELVKLVQMSQNILFTTELVPFSKPKPHQWWYYGLEHWQHASFYTLTSLQHLASGRKLNFNSNRRNIYLFTSKKCNPILFIKLTSRKIASILNILMRKKSPLPRDYKALTGIRPI